MVGIDILTCVRVIVSECAESRTLQHVSGNKLEVASHPLQFFYIQNTEMARMNSIAQAQ